MTPAGLLIKATFPIRTFPLLRRLHVGNAKRPFPNAHVRSTSEIDLSSQQAAHHIIS